MSKNLNKFEKYVLDKLGPEQSRKWLRSMSTLISTYQKYVLRKQLEHRRDEALSKLPKANVLMATTLLDNEIKYLVNDASLPNRTAELTHLLFGAAVKMLASYIEISKVIGVQPITGPIGTVFNLQYASDEDERLSLNVVSTAVEATSRKLRASFNVESSSHLFPPLPNIDVEAEMAYVLGSEIGSEVVNDVVYKLLGLASEFKPTLMPDNLKNKLNAEVESMIVINQAAADIARATRRGMGNFLIMSPDTFSAISTNPKCPITDTNESNFQFTSGLLYAGTWVDRYKIYLSVLPDFHDGKVLIGYRGSGETDVGVVAAPYTPVISAGPVIDPNTFEPKLEFITRGGFVKNDSTFATANEYYRLVDLKPFLAQE